MPTEHTEYTEEYRFTWNTAGPNPSFRFFYHGWRGFDPDKSKAGQRTRKMPAKNAKGESLSRRARIPAGRASQGRGSQGRGSQGREPSRNPSVNIRDIRGEKFRD